MLKNTKIRLSSEEEMKYKLKRIRGLASEIANNNGVDVYPTAQAEIIVKMVNEIQELLAEGGLYID